MYTRLPQGQPPNAPASKCTCVTFNANRLDLLHLQRLFLFGQYATDARHIRIHQIALSLRARDKFLDDVFHRLSRGVVDALTGAVVSYEVQVECTNLKLLMMHPNRDDGCIKWPTRSIDRVPMMVHARVSSTALVRVLDVGRSVCRIWMGRMALAEHRIARGTVGMVSVFQ